jgi:hypothetical protein
METIYKKRLANGPFLYFLFPPLTHFVLAIPLASICIFTASCLIGKRATIHYTAFGLKFEHHTVLVDRLRSLRAAL